MTAEKAGYPVKMVARLPEVSSHGLLSVAGRRRAHGRVGTRARRREARVA